RAKLSPHQQGAEPAGDLLVSGLRGGQVDLQYRCPLVHCILSVYNIQRRDDPVKPFCRTFLEGPPAPPNNHRCCETAFWEIAPEESLRNHRGSQVLRNAAAWIEAAQLQSGAPFPWCSGEGMFTGLRTARTAFPRSGLGHWLGDRPRKA